MDTIVFSSPEKFAASLFIKVQSEWAKQNMPDGVIKIVYGVLNITSLLVDSPKNPDHRPTVHDIKEILTREYLQKVIQEAKKVGLAVNRLLLTGTDDCLYVPGNIALTIEYTES